MSINDVKNMPIQERMQLMEALWDSFIYDDATVSPTWHKDILENRKQLMSQNNVKTYTLDELKQKR